MTRTKKNCRLAVEQLEDRCVPTANSVVLQNGVLSIAVDPTRAHNVAVSQPSAGTVQVTLDNTQFTLTAPVTSRSIIRAATRETSSATSPPSAAS